MRILVWMAVVAGAMVCYSTEGVAQGTRHDDTLVVFNAGSLAQPLKAALDSFALRTHVVVQQENAGSLESARKLTELGRIPDVLALADYTVFPKLLMPGQTTWYLPFARNRVVLVYTDRSAGSHEITPENWWRIVTRPGVEVGRGDPNVDPAGYRTLLVWQLAERFYHRPALADALLAAAPLRDVRPKAEDVLALVQSGDLDYAWEYESVAQAAGLRYLRLPSSIDLSDPAQAAFYAQASVRVAGKTPSDTLVVRGEPIVYGLSIPTHAPHAAMGVRFIRFLFSDTGRRIVGRAQLELLAKPVVVGTGAPEELVEGLTS